MSCGAAERGKAGKWVLSRRMGFPTALPNLGSQRFSCGTQLSRHLAPFLAGRASLGPGPRQCWGWQDSTARQGLWGQGPEYGRASHPECLGKGPHSATPKISAAEASSWLSFPQCGLPEVKIQRTRWQGGGRSRFPKARALLRKMTPKWRGALTPLPP